MPRPRDIRREIDLAGHSNVPSLRRGVYVAVSPPAGVALRDATLLGLIVAGYDEAQAGAILKLGVPAIKRRVRALKDALGAADLPDLAIAALRRRIVIIREP